MSKEWLEIIKDKKHQLNAVILAHYYQIPAIQEAADFVGDSFQLAQQASNTDADIIISCGVTFMAESAKILNPSKKVLIPELTAGCPMADMISAEELRKLKDLYPGAVVVCYVNSSAAVKAESDICCTSANAVQVVASIPLNKRIIFVPDRNLGHYVANQTKRDIILWEGYCPAHENLNLKALEEQIQKYPQAKTVVHPECRPEVIARADAVCSTGGMLEWVKKSSAREFIIGTEEGFVYSLQKACPDKKFYLARQQLLCADMKKIGLPELAQSLDKLQYEIIVPEEISMRALKSLQRMLEIV